MFWFPYKIYPHTHINKNVCAYIHTCLHMYLRCTYAYICKHLYTHRCTFKVAFLHKLFNASPLSVGKSPSSSAHTGPCSLCVSFCHPISSSFFEPYTWAWVHHLKQSHHTLAFCLTAFTHGPMTGTKWHRDTCLASFPFPKAGAGAKGKDVLWVVMLWSFLTAFPPPHTRPAYKSHTAASLLCAVHAKGSKVNSFSCLIHFADTRAGTLSIVTSLDAKTEGKMKAEGKYLVTRGN